MTMLALGQSKELNSSRCLPMEIGGYTNTKEFDPGSGRTLAARLTHASRTELRSLLLNLVADG